MPLPLQPLLLPPILLLLLPLPSPQLKLSLLLFLLPTPIPSCPHPRPRSRPQASCCRSTRAYEEGKDEDQDKEVEYFGPSKRTQRQNNKQATNGLEEYAEGKKSGQRLLLEWSESPRTPEWAVS